MSKNLMPEIVKILGVEMGEEFRLRVPDKEVCEPGIFAFIEDEGLSIRKYEGLYEPCLGDWFEQLCLGIYEIVEMPFKPQSGDIFFYPCPYLKQVLSEKWDNHTMGYALVALGMVYRTQAEAEKHFAADYEKLTGKPLEV